jgi:ABC-type nitrate/sulfonate/bicarbonate transport system ATPase subunit
MQGDAFSMTDVSIAWSEDYACGLNSGARGLAGLLRPVKAEALAAPAAEPAWTASGDRPLIELRKVSKSFGPVIALDNLEATILPGELVTVVGPSGCGKSTLFNILAGLEEPDPGNILRFRGRSSAASELLGQVSFMPQRDLLLPWRNVIDNAILALEIEGMPRAQARAEALKMLPEFGLSGFEAQYPNQLSGGMRQRVALMRTFLFKRDLMLLDEPFGALDALTRTMMQRWLLDVWQKHRRTVLFITHDVDEAIFLGDRVLVMTARPGKVKLEQKIDLPRPRKADIVTSPEFVGLKKTLLDAIEEESMKSFMTSGH